MLPLAVRDPSFFSPDNLKRARYIRVDFPRRAEMLRLRERCGPPRVAGLERSGPLQQLPRGAGRFRERQVLDPRAVWVDRVDVLLARDGRVVVYMGDDERNEYIYRYVSNLPWRKARRQGINPLDDGLLYVAKFHSSGDGEWLPLEDYSAVPYRKLVNAIHRVATGEPPVA